ncbi:hypothetical protein [Natronorubrum sp. FCH18a]|uniref:hypothetical protein n=1 Tax=Natronorubrum sp. FCH18a TaxID=3447018 RepID=UPI003F5135B2
MPGPLKGLTKALGALDKLSGGNGGWGANVEGADKLAAALEEEFEDWEFTTGYAVGASASYAVFVEMGTSRMQGTPALQNAIDATMGNLDSLAEQADSGDELIQLIALDIEAGYKGDVPVDTGHLQSSIYAQEI